MAMTFFEWVLDPVSSQVAALTAQVTQLREEISMNQTELLTVLSGVGAALSSASAQLTKAHAEILAAIAAGGNTTPEVDAAVSQLQGVATSLATAAQALDDLNPDTPPQPGQPA
jgi:hypothetical protein